MADPSARKLLERALKAGEERNYRKAVELLTTLLSQTDSMPEALLYLGRARHALGEPGPAIDAFRLYLGSGGDPGAGFFFLGRAYLSGGRPRSAVTCLRRSVEADAGRAPSWALLGAALLKLRKTKSAVDCLQRAVELAPQDGRILRGYLNALFARALRLQVHGDADMARQMLSFVIGKGLDGPAPRLWRARAYRDLGRLREALADCEAALGFSPEDASIRWMRAGLLLAAGRQAEALAEFEAIRVEHPDLPSLPQDDRSLARLRASVAFREGRWKEAVSESIALLRENPKDAALRALAAESLRAMGEVERSCNHWLRAVEADPSSPELRLGLASALWDSGKFNEALAAAERARKLGADSDEVDYYSALCRARLGDDSEELLPTLQALIRRRTSSGEGADPRLMFALAEALYRSGRPDLAAGWFEKVLFLVPEHELSLLYRISVAESLGDRAALPAAYEAYLARYPDNGRLRRELVGILVASRDWKRAAAAMEGGLSYADPGEKGRQLLAVCYRNSGRFREAARAYRDLLRKNPASPQLLVGLAHCLDKDGKAEFALALLEKAPAEAKATADPWILQAALLLRLGRMEAAVDALRKATEVDENNERAWRSLGLLYRRQGLHEFAERCATRADELGRSRPDPRQGRAAAAPRSAKGGGTSAKGRSAGAAATAAREGAVTGGSDAKDGSRGLAEADMGRKGATGRGRGR